MWLSSILGFWKSACGRPRNDRSSAPRHRPTRLRLEQLEDRTLPSLFYAATASDLIADINAANKAGGPNLIVLTAPNTSPYVLTAVDNTTNGANGLPVIGSKKGDNLTIQGNGDTIERSTAAGTPAFRLFDVANGNTLTLQNMTLQNGLAFGSGAAADGGAIYNQGQTILESVTVQGNTAQGADGGFVKNNHLPPGQNAAGGAIWSSGSVVLSSYNSQSPSTVIANNSALGGAGGTNSSGLRGQGGFAYGGGLCVAGGTVTSIGTHFTDNLAQGGVGGGYSKVLSGSGYAYGGGIYVTGGTVSLSGDTLDHNTAQGGESVAYPYCFAFGGGLCVVGGGSASLSNGTVEYNTAIGGLEDAVGGYTSGFGGGVYAGGSAVTLYGDVVEFNYAFGIDSEGGGIYVPLQSTTVYLDSFTVANTLYNYAWLDPNIGPGEYILA